MGTEYSSLSGKEHGVLETVKNLDTVFTARDVVRFTDLSRDEAYNTLKRLTNKDWIQRVEKGKYALQDREALEIATGIAWPSYLSFWTALHQHGLTTQVPRPIYVAATRQHSDVELDAATITFITLKRAAFFGYTSEKYVIAEKEKAVLDSLYLPRYGGGVEHVEAVLTRNWDAFDTGKLVAYATRMENSSLVSRLGFIITRNSLPLPDAHRETLHANRSTTYVDYIPATPGEKENSEWRVRHR